MTQLSDKRSSQDPVSPSPCGCTPARSTGRLPLPAPATPCLPPHGHTPARSPGSPPFTDGRRPLAGTAEALCPSPLRPLGCPFSSTSCCDSCLLARFLFFLGDAAVTSGLVGSEGGRSLGSPSQRSAPSKLGGKSRVSGPDTRPPTGTASTPPRSHPRNTPTRAGQSTHAIHGHSQACGASEKRTHNISHPSRGKSYERNEAAAGPGLGSRDLICAGQVWTRSAGYSASRRDAQHVAF